MTEFREDKDGRLQFKPLTPAQWTDSVEVYKKAKLYADSFSDLVKSHAEKTGKTTAQIRQVIKAKADATEQELSEQLQGTLELLGGGE